MFNATLQFDPGEDVTRQDRAACCLDASEQAMGPGSCRARRCPAFSGMCCAE